MKMNKQKTQHRWRKAATGLLALLLSFGDVQRPFAETAVGAGALREERCRRCRWWTQGCRALLRRRTTRRAGWRIALSSWIAIWRFAADRQAQTPKVLAVTYTYTREVSKPKPGVNREESQTKPEESQAKVEGQTNKVGEASVNIAGGK